MRKRKNEKQPAALFRSAGHNSPPSEAASVPAQPPWSGGATTNPGADHSLGRTRAETTGRHKDKHGHKHTTDKLVAELLSLAEGPNLPSFISTYWLHIAGKFQLHGSLTGLEWWGLKNMHRQLVWEGYVKCEECQSSLQPQF